MRLDLDRFAAVVAGTIKTALAGISERVSHLEQRQIRDGIDGAPGPVGPQGEKGLDGMAGRDGTDGEPGPQGPPGPPGPQGEKGVDGVAGRDGRDGLHGIPGEKGLDGKDGRDGIDGKDGAIGAPGRDGTLENLKVSYDGERTLTFTFKDGTPIEGGEVRLPIVLYRGTFDSAKQYEPGDSVTWDGSMWIAKQETQGFAPGGPSAIAKDVWALSVMRGRQGKTGPAGDVGPIGKQGPQGPPGRNGF